LSVLIENILTPLCSYTFSPQSHKTRRACNTCHIGSQSGVREPSGGEKIGVWSSDKNFRKWTA